MVRATGRRAEAGHFDAFRLAQRREALDGELDATQRSRLAGLLARLGSPAVVRWRIEGGRDDLDRPMLTVQVRGSLPLVCQRCLQRFDAAIDQRSELLLAHNEAELARLDADEREVVLAAKPLDATSLIEDELLLSLPFAPMHPAGQCAPAPSEGHSAQGKPVSPTPFARLAAVKKGGKISEE